MVDTLVNLQKIVAEKELRTLWLEYVMLLNKRIEGEISILCSH